MINYWPLLGIALVVLGFALKFNPMLVVTVSAIVTGLIAGMDPIQVISTFGKAFNDNRIIAIVWIVLPVIGLLERFGLQQRAMTLIRSFRGVTAGRLLIFYLVYRQVISALGLKDTAGHPQTVRPLVAPMAVAAAEKQHGQLTDDEANVLAAIRALPAPGDVDEDALAAALGPILAPLIQAGASEAQVEAAMRRVFASAGQSEGGTL